MLRITTFSPSNITWIPNNYGIEGLMKLCKLPVLIEALKVFLLSLI